MYVKGKFPGLTLFIVPEDFPPRARKIKEFH